MLRLVLFLLGVIAIASGLHWLADRPGNLTLEWQGYVLETSVFRAIVILSLLMATTIAAWGVIRGIWRSPATVGHIITRRRERKGLDAISHGMIAIGSGDRNLALRAAVQAKKSLPNEPLTHLLRAQTAQLQGDNATARRMFEAMLASPDTEPLGLRGLFLEASREGEMEPARQFAERAMRLRPSLEWPTDALFDLQCKSRDLDGALETLAVAKKHGHVDKKIAERRRAVLLAGKAQQLEDDNAEEALNLALESHGLAPDLVPAAAIAGRILASRGQTPKAAKILQKTWRLAPHPDLATAYAHARIGDSPTDRLDRVRQLAKLDPNASEGALAFAATALDAREWKMARDALEPLLRSDKLTQRVATMMAKLEGGEHGDTGRVREWLARAVNAPRDPAWTAEGIVSDTWSPISPSGRLDAFEWRVPVAELETLGHDALEARTESLVQLGAPSMASRPSRTGVRSDTEWHTDAPPSRDVEKAARIAETAIDLDEPSSAPAASWRPKAPQTNTPDAIRQPKAQETAPGASRHLKAQDESYIEDAIEVPITQPAPRAPAASETIATPTVATARPAATNGARTVTADDFVIELPKADTRKSA